MSEYTESRRSTVASDWVTGGIALAVVSQTLVGVLQFVQGLAALINDELLVSLPNYLFAFDFTVWGWIHLTLGVVLIATGIALAARNRVAAWASIFFLCLGASANFLFLPIYPLWSIVLLGIDFFALWAVTKSGLLGDWV
ncbi:hypothetical protein SAMN04489752_2908 [Brevibacterium siliguriense]|uniref:DUF7144 domain-containing protein n=1 Tax=Brevibacterium siliguriense TaxID=1136497 RepID=A0A1H1W9P6_9MICO|nr:hypothetical protein [Brevibacterium siliguriense]SDS93937.1 hypothetical protein SAMN04489752_2908 [Brevibacterium siliguriense]